MTGKELHQILLAKWGHSYDIQLRRGKSKVLVEVMWKYLEQVSFPMNETEYMEHLEAIAIYLNAWGSAEKVTNHILNSRDRPRLGKPITITIDLGEISSEWLLDDG
jgi:hypothetical protein